MFVVLTQILPQGQFHADIIFFLHYPLSYDLPPIWRYCVSALQSFLLDPHGLKLKCNNNIILESLQTDEN